MSYSTLLLWKREAGETKLPNRAMPSFEWLTEDERELVARVVDKLPPRNEVHILATLYGVKRGSMIGEWMPAAEEFGPKPTVTAIRDSDHFLPEELCRTLNLSHAAKLEELRDKPAIHGQTFIARSPVVLESLPPFYKRAKMSTVESHYLDEWGHFLGVPARDNGWYQDPEEAVDVEEATPLAETTSVSLTPVDEWFADLVPYLPRPTSAGVTRAVNEGRRYAEAVYQFYGESGFNNVVEKTRLGLSENKWTAEARDVSSAEVREVLVETV